MIESASVAYLCNSDFQEKLAQEMIAYGGKHIESDVGHCVQIEEKLFRQISKITAVERSYFRESKVYFFDDAFLLAESIKKIDIDFLIIDERNCAHTTEEVQAIFRQSNDPKHHFTTRKMLVILPDNKETARRTFQLGSTNIRKVLVNPRNSIELFVFVIEAINEFRKKLSKTSLCISGGGLDGYIYSLGVCRALDDCFVDYDCRGFDLYCGVSSGAMLCTSFAAGIHSSSLVDQIYKRKGILEPLTLSVIFDFAGKEFFKRVFNTVRSLPRLEIDGILAQLKQLIPVGFFKGEKLKKFIASQLEIVGQVDQLDKLIKPVFISATDQDTGEHVIFGEAPWQSIPVSQAVRASTALPPFYLPENIKGHWFTDGQLTSNSDFNTAIRKGAGLIVLIDPMVAYTSSNPGSVIKLGGYFAAIQAIKSLVHSRFKSVLKHAMDLAPEVDFVVFTQSEEAMIAMAGNPMGANFKTELEVLGYKGTIQQILDHYSSVQRKFAKHGIRLKSSDELKSLLK